MLRPLTSRKLRYKQGGIHAKHILRRWYALALERHLASGRVPPRASNVSSEAAEPWIAQTARDGAASGGFVGRIDLPTIRQSAAIAEGVDATTLWRAVGHLPGTAFPGEAGNVVLAGHRDTHFRKLDQLRESDVIRITTTDGIFTYLVNSTAIVGPKQTEVTKPAADPLLTLITCYPFHFVGPAPQRFIVRAVLTNLAESAATQQQRGPED